MNLVIAYDGSVASGIALDDLQWAGLPANTRAIVLAVAEPGTPIPQNHSISETGFADERIAVAEQWAEEACSRLSGYFPAWDLQMETRLGSAASEILDKLNGWPADLVVVGTHGHTRLARVVLGSVSLKLTRESPCSVRVGRASKHDGRLRLLVGTDGSLEAVAAVDEICNRCWPRGTEVRVLSAQHALTPIDVEALATGLESYRNVNEQRKFLQHAAEQAAEKLRQADLAASSVVQEGNPERALLDEAKAWNADAIFVGARGMGRVERFLLGSVSSAAVAHAPCTVEVIRHASERSAR
jgi:nucleotide-binding universal stress UspA family protein